MSKLVVSVRTKRDMVKPFRDLDFGEVFRGLKKGSVHVYQKVRLGTDAIGVNLATGVASEWTPDINVMPMDAELIAEDEYADQDN